MRLLLVGLVCGLGVASCGGAPAASGPPASAAASSSGTALAPPSHSLRRSDVSSFVCAGFGTFLQTVAIDEHPVFTGGKFHGFRVAGLAPMWRGIEIAPGDVVTRVNGMPIERPEQALEAFRSLDVASELHVDYERDGEPHEMRYAIVDDGAAEAKPCSTTTTGATGSSATVQPAAPRLPSKTIGGSRK